MRTRIARSGTRDNSLTCTRVYQCVSFLLSSLFYRALEREEGGDGGRGEGTAGVSRRYLYTEKIEGDIVSEVHTR